MKSENITIPKENRASSWVKERYGRDFGRLIFVRPRPLGWYNRFLVINGSSIKKLLGQIACRQKLTVEFMSNPVWAANAVDRLLDIPQNTEFSRLFAKVPTKTWAEALEDCGISKEALKKALSSNSSGDIDPELNRAIILLKYLEKAGAIQLTAEVSLAKPELVKEEELTLEEVMAISIVERMADRAARNMAEACTKAAAIIKSSSRATARTLAEPYLRCWTDVVRKFEEERIVLNRDVSHLHALLYDALVVHAHKTPLAEKTSVGRKTIELAAPYMTIVGPYTEGKGDKGCYPSYEEHRAHDAINQILLASGAGAAKGAEGEAAVPLISEKNTRQVALSKVGCDTKTRGQGNSMLVLRIIRDARPQHFTTLVGHKVPQGIVENAIRFESDDDFSARLGAVVSGAMDLIASDDVLEEVASTIKGNLRRHKDVTSATNKKYLKWLAITECEDFAMDESGITQYKVNPNPALFARIYGTDVALAYDMPCRTPGEVLGNTLPEVDDASCDIREQLPFIPLKNKDDGLVEFDVDSYLLPIPQVTIQLCDRTVGLDDYLLAKKDPTLADIPMLASPKSVSVDSLLGTKKQWSDEHIVKNSYRTSEVLRCAHHWALLLKARTQHKKFLKEWLKRYFSAATSAIDCEVLKSKTQNGEILQRRDVETPFDRVRNALDASDAYLSVLKIVDPALGAVMKHLVTSSLEMFNIENLMGV